jgi:hypothetical protein
MEKTISGSDFQTDAAVRRVEERDSLKLGELLYEADRGTVDDEGLPVSNSIEEVRLTLSGRYGRFLPECSYLGLEGDRIVSAVLMTFYEKDQMPLVAYTMTHPIYKNRGWCKTLLRLGCGKLHELGYKKCFLSVNPKNLAAVAAYKGAGFQIKSRKPKTES